MKERKLAIIQGVRFGVGDYGKVCMWFSAHLGRELVHEAALQVPSVANAVKLIKAEERQGLSRIKRTPVLGAGRYRLDHLRRATRRIDANNEFKPSP